MRERVTRWSTESQVSTENGAMKMTMKADYDRSTSEGLVSQGRDEASEHERVDCQRVVDGESVVRREAGSAM